MTRQRPTRFQTPVIQGRTRPGHEAALATFWGAQSLRGRKAVWVPKPITRAMQVIRSERRAA